MKRILIIEDVNKNAKALENAIQGLGEIVLCTMPNFNEVRDFKKMVMPSEEEAVRLISEADIILMDCELGTKTPYSGKELLPHCRGKKVIGISRLIVEDCEKNFGGKELLNDDQFPDEADKLRKLVSEALA